MMIEAIPQQYSTIVLVLMLAAVFVIAFKVMELVFETLTVSALSGGFYVAYTVLIGGGMEQIVLNDLLLFAVLGAAFYMAYSFLSSAYTLARKVIHVPYIMLTWIYRGSRRTASFISEKISGEEEHETVQGNVSMDEEESDDSNNKVKEVVLSQDEKKEDD